MILANFDLSFFTSIPGMLITGGVLLLLIALIIFIATGSKKDKKDKKAEAGSTDNTNNTVATTPTIDANVATEPVMPAGVVNSEVATEPVTSVVTPDNTTVENAPQTLVTTPVDQSEPINVVENNVPTVSEATSQNLNQPIESNTIPNEVVSPQVEMPAQTVEPDTTNVNPVVMPSEVNNIDPVSTPDNTLGSINQENTEVASAPTITIVNEEPKESTVIESPKPIYGGTDPVIPKIEVEGNEHRPIYGGANPLENTGAIPTINSNTMTQTVPTVETPKTESEVINIPTIDTTPVNKVEPIKPVQNEKTEEQVVKEQPKQEVEVESLF